MIKHFLTWLEGLTWQPALLFLLALAIGACVVILLIDAGIRKFADWRERRAIRARNWELRQQRVQLIVDAQREREQREATEAALVAKRMAVRVWRDRVQQNRESKQFHVPAAFRDMKGVHR
jgi:biopolymer transport protein ExbB/TolQ